MDVARERRRGQAGPAGRVRTPCGLEGPAWRAVPERGAEWNEVAPRCEEPVDPGTRVHACFVGGLRQALGRGAFPGRGRRGEPAVLPTYRREGDVLIDV